MAEVIYSIIAEISGLHYAVDRLQERLAVARKKGEFIGVALIAVLAVKLAILVKKGLF